MQSAIAPGTPPSALVVGGSGFVGRAIVQALQQQGYAVRVFDRMASDEPRVDMRIGDIRDAAALHAACQDVDAVFQCAALIDWRPGAEKRIHEVNVVGNRHVIEACVAQQVARLIYTSSIDVVFDGRPIRNGDETLPYPKRYLDAYGAAKATAERDVLAANGHGGLLTCALRPAGVYGPHDQLRLPAIIAAARSGKLVRMGDGRARFSHVYVENLAYAHVLAASRLLPGAATAGQCYFITDHEASNFYDFFTPFLQALDLPLPTRSIPYRAAYALGALAEWSARLPRANKGQPPLLTRYVVASTCVDFYFSHARATRDFGYLPPVSAEQARARTIEWLQAQQDLVATR